MICQLYWDGQGGDKEGANQKPRKVFQLFLELTAMSESTEQNPTVFMVVEGYGFAEAS